MSCPQFCPQLPPDVNRPQNFALDDKQRKPPHSCGVLDFLGTSWIGRWWPETGLNRRRRPFQGRALPLSYLASVVGVCCSASIAESRANREKESRRYSWLPGHRAAELCSWRAGLLSPMKSVSCLPRPYLSLPIRADISGSSTFCVGWPCWRSSTSMRASTCHGTSGSSPADGMAGAAWTCSSCCQAF